MTANILDDIKDAQRELRALKASKNITFPMLNFTSFQHVIEFAAGQNKRLTCTMHSSNNTLVPVADYALDRGQLATALPALIGADWSSVNAQTSSLTMTFTAAGGGAESFTVTIMGFNLASVDFKES